MTAQNLTLASQEINDVKLEEVSPKAEKITKPTVVESHGEAPLEYDDDW